MNIYKVYNRHYIPLYVSATSEEEAARLYQAYRKQQGWKLHQEVTVQRIKPYETIGVIGCDLIRYLAEPVIVKM